LSAVSLREHHPKAVPGAAEPARRLDGAEGDQRPLEQQLVVDPDSQRADALALRDRRDQRLDALDLGLDLVGLAARHGHAQFAVEAAGDRGRPALPDLGLAGRVAFRVDAHRVEVLEAVVEQLLRLDRARRLRTGADDDRDQAPFTVEPRLLAPRGRDQAIAGRFGVPGLHAVDTRVDGQQAVAIRLADVVVR